MPHCINVFHIEYSQVNLSTVPWNTFSNNPMFDCVSYPYPFPLWVWKVSSSMNNFLYFGHEKRHPRLELRIYYGKYFLKCLWHFLRLLFYVSFVRCFFLLLLFCILSTLFNWTPSCCAPTQNDEFTRDAGQVKSQMGVCQCCKMGAENAWLPKIKREGGEETGTESERDGHGTNYTIALQTAAPLFWIN